MDLLSGDVDFSAVMRQVRAMGYDGWVSAELTPYQNAPEATVYSAARALDVILNLA